jgi:hypothetical protein
MDFSMSYSQNTTNNLPITRTCLFGPGTIDDLLVPHPEHKEKNPAYFFESVCRFGVNVVKLKFVEELMNYINVDSYGTCLRNKEMPAFMRVKGLVPTRY